MTTTSAEFLSLCPSLFHLTLSSQFFESSRQTSFISHCLTSLFQSSYFDHSLLLSQTLTMLALSEEMAWRKAMSRTKCTDLPHIIFFAQKAYQLSKCFSRWLSQICVLF